MRYFQPLLPFVLGWALILSSESLSALGLINGLAQLLLFGLVVCLPTWRTGRMSYVDIGWPWGLVLLALLALVFSESSQMRLMVFSALLAGVGLRMGLGALNLWRLGKLRKEFPDINISACVGQKRGKAMFH
jgi:steroid 5-alpha reductase family enzyme